MVATFMYEHLNEAEKANLKIYWYTGKDQKTPLNAKEKSRNCHVKLMSAYSISLYPTTSLSRPSPPPFSHLGRKSRGGGKGTNDEGRRKEYVANPQSWMRKSSSKATATKIHNPGSTLKKSIVSRKAAPSPRRSEKRSTRIRIRNITGW